MPGRSGSGRTKRRKEQDRQEKQRAKAARKLQRKLEKQHPPDEAALTLETPLSPAGPEPTSS
ncbi:MAG: hypothetical protein ACRD2Q_01120 [Terriglobales bacterium]